VAGIKRSATQRVGDAQTRYFFLRRSSSVEANPTLNIVIVAGSGTLRKIGEAKAGNDSIDSKKAEYVRRMDFS
jgi:hypothetical protein